MSAPANDLCVNATVIASLPYSVTGVDNTDATVSVDDPVMIAAGDGSVGGATTLFKTVWYRYTPATTQVVRITATPATGNDLGFGVFTGSCGAFTELVSFFRAATIQLTGGVPYYICVGSFTNAGITFDLNIDTSTNPHNQIINTATPIASLPFSATVDFTGVIDEAAAYTGVTQKSRHVWYRWVAPADGVVGVFGSSNLTTFIPVSSAFTTPFNMYSPTQVGGPNASYSYDAASVPFYMPVTAGQTYYFSFGLDQAAAITDTLSVSIEAFVETPVIPAGSIAIPDDGSYHPLAILDPTTGGVLRYVMPGDYAAGENGDILPNGKVLMADPAFGLNGSLGTERLVVYGQEFSTELASVPINITANSPVSARPTGDGWYVGNVNGVNRRVHLYDEDLNLLSTWTVGVDPSLGFSPNIMGMAVSPDASILYYTSYLVVSGPTNPARVMRWDLVNDVALSDLAGTNGLVPTREMLVLADGSIIVAYFDSVGAPTLSTVIRYSAAGATLNTYARADTESFEMRLARVPSDPTAFGLWTKIAGGLSRFEIIRASDGVVLSTVTRPHYTSGLSSEAATLTPTTRFGFSFCCPWFILPLSIGDPNPVIGPLVWVHIPRRIADLPLEPEGT